LLSTHIIYSHKDEYIHDGSNGVSEPLITLGSFPSDEINAKQRQLSNNNSTFSLLSKLREDIIVHPHQQVTLTCYIPPSHVGSIIGRRGATIVNV